MGIRNLQIIVSLLWRCFFMEKKAKYSKELKLEIIKRYLKGESSVKLANEYEMSNMSGDIRKQAHRYEVLGENAFMVSNTSKSYTKEFKEQVIKEYLLGGISFSDLPNNYNLSSCEVVRRWVLKYNNGMEIKDYNPKSEVYAMKSRKTTKEISEGLQI